MNSQGRDPRYAEVVRLIESYGIMPERAPGLEVMREGLKRLNVEAWPAWQKLESDAGRLILIAGTNGKGSVAAALEALFRSRGEVTGLYTSPHLVSTTERIRRAGRDISESEFVRVFERVRALAGGQVLSHFEMLTLMAVDYFCSGAHLPPVDRLIVEVGLGGTWDATNALPHKVVAITSLGMDHENILGRSLIEIAKNKFGVVNTGAQVFHAPFDAEIEALAQSVRQKTSSQWTLRAPFEYRAEIASHSEPRFYISWKGVEYPSPLAGRRGAENLALALTLFEGLGFEASIQWPLALSLMRWPGRMERIEWGAHRRAVYLSGDHNVQGVRSLIELLEAYPRKRLHVVFGVSRDKDFDAMLRELDAGLARSAYADYSLYLSESRFKARSVDDFGEWSKRARLKVADPRKLLDQIVEEADPEDKILVTGSLYLVGRVREHKRE
jgi:dihydrofolate synthase/folylpolyglutamate synthase